MIDLNTVLNTALTQALNEALKPLLERIATIESRVGTMDPNRLDAICHRLDTLEAREGTVDDLEHTIDERIGNFLDNDDLTSRIDADELDLHNAIEQTLESMDLTDAIAEAVRDLLSDARITLL